MTERLPSGHNESVNEPPPATSVFSSTRHPTMSDEHYRMYRDLIRSRTGLYFPEKKRLDLERAVHALFRESEFQSLSELFKSLQASGDRTPLWEQAVRILTVNETYFFRNKLHFQALEEMILPEIIMRRRQQNDLHLRIWSAGCASGEEAYSLAMLLSTILPGIATWDISILGTDINRQSIEWARTGQFREWSFRATDRKSFDRYFSRREGLLEIHQDIKRMVTFRYYNLIAARTADHRILDKLENCDLILCRNVTIYFDRDSISQLMQHFFNMLSPGGWLLVGEAEPSPVNYAPFVVQTWREGFYYQKAFPESEHPHSGEHGGNALPSKSQFFRTVRSTPARVRKHKSQEFTRSDALNRLAETMPGKQSGEPEIPENRTQSVMLRATSVTAPTAFSIDDKSVRIDVIDEEQAKLLEAFRLADAGSLGDAEKICLELLHANRLLPDVYYLLAMISLARNEYREAESFLKKTLYLNSTFLMAHYGLWTLYQLTDQGTRSVRQLSIFCRMLDALPASEKIPYSGGMTVGHFRDIVCDE